VSDPRRALEPNLAILAAYVEPDDVIVDVGGGSGRLSLPLALRCREVVNVDPSTAMLAAFEANAGRAGISNVPPCSPTSRPRTRRAGPSRWSTT
jgi:ubiquinone/menaquinone biosynthesis C-methylase UbiE